MACLRQLSGLSRHSVRRTTPIPSSPKGYYLFNPTVAYAPKPGYSCKYDESTNIDDLFENWCWRYNKWYSSEEEKLYSREVFGEKVAIMLRIKEKDPSYILGCNGLMDIQRRHGRPWQRTKRERDARDPARREFLEKILRNWEERFKGQWARTPPYALGKCQDLHIRRGTFTY